MATQGTDDGLHDEPELTPAQLDARITDLAQQQVQAHKNTFWSAVACSVIIGLVVGLLLVAWSEFGPQTQPETADDRLESLLRPGPHCYSTSSEMAAARQRALAAIDRVHWEEDFTRRWAEDHPESRGSLYLPPTPPFGADTTPRITGPTDPAVPPSADPELVVDSDVCFGVTAPRE